MVPFLDLKTQYKALRSEILEAVTRSIDSGAFVLGPEVKAFEDVFAPYTGTTNAIGMNSGTAALQLALIAAGVEAGDEVITVAHTFVATVAAVMYLGAKPVLVDVDPVSYTMDPSKIEAAITSKTKVIMPVHLYGQSADMDPILEIAKKHGLKVIEDAAQAHGAEYKGRRCGSLGDMACFSFYPGKNLGACGEGGAVTTNSAEYAKTLRILRDWGQEVKYHHIMLGYNARLEGVQGAVLGVKMKYIECWTEQRRAVAKQYAERIGGLEHVVLPQECEGRRHVYHVYAVRVKDREGFMKFLADEGVGTAIHYPFPVHTLEGYKSLGYKQGDFPVAEEVAATVVSLPMFPELTQDQIDTVVAGVNKYNSSL